MNLITIMLPVCQFIALKPAPKPPETQSLQDPHLDGASQWLSGDEWVRRAEPRCGRKPDCTSTLGNFFQLLYRCARSIRSLELETH